MAMRLVKIKPDHYVVVDDSEIKEGDLVTNGNYITQAVNEWWTKFYNGGIKKDFWKITHSTQPLGIGWQQEVIELSIQEVKELIGEVDVENRAESRFGTDIDSIRGSKEYDLNTDLKRGFVSGYNQALEDNKDKKYTFKDLIDCYEQGFVDYKQGLYCNAEENIKSSPFFIKHKEKIEWEVEIVDGKLKLK